MIDSGDDEHIIRLKFFAPTSEHQTKMAQWQLLESTLSFEILAHGSKYLLVNKNRWDVKKCWAVAITESLLYTPEKYFEISPMHTQIYWQWFYATIKNYFLLFEFRFVFMSVLASLVSQTELRGKLSGVVAAAAFIDFELAVMTCRLQKNISQFSREMFEFLRQTRLRS